MKTVAEIIIRVDHVISVVPGSAILSDEEWLTLKTAVLAQQITNTGNQKLCPYHKNYSPCAWGLGVRCREHSPCNFKAELRESA